MGLTSLSTQIGVIFGSFAFLVIFHWYLLYYCKSKWITSIPQKSICLFNASIFAFICGFGGLYVWLYPSQEQIVDPLHGTNILQEYICLIGIGYFIYDILIVIFIDPTIAYLLHAILGIAFGYLGGVIPLASHSGSFVMSYEISTPFKNLRYFMIKWGKTKNKLFRLIEILFILTFIYLRLVIGLPAMYNVTEYFLNELNKLNDNNNTFRLYGTYFLLYGGWFNVLLNVYWSAAIFKAIIVFSHRKGDYVPDDENEIVYETPYEYHCIYDDDDINNINNNKSKSFDKSSTCLYFGELYFRNHHHNNHNQSNNRKDIKINIYDNNAPQSYYKCDIGAILMNLNKNYAFSKEWGKYLLHWNRSSHFGDINKPLIDSVRELLYYYSTVPLTKKQSDNNNNYHTSSLAPIKYGNIYLLTLLRTFGIGWNPISVYYCYDETNTILRTVLFEMINVPWSCRHIYILPLDYAHARSDIDNEHIIEFMKICLFSPMDFTHFNNKPNGYHCNIGDPIATSDILSIYGYVYSFIDNINDNNNNIPDSIYTHKWGTSSCTSSCIIPKSKESSQSAMIEFGLHKCKKYELNNLNLLYLFWYFPFQSFVLRFQLFLFMISNWWNNNKITNNKYSNIPYHSMHKKKLSFIQLFKEFLKVFIGAICFFIGKIWNIRRQCRYSLFGERSKNDKDVFFPTT